MPLEQPKSTQIRVEMDFLMKICEFYHQMGRQCTLIRERPHSTVTAIDRCHFWRRLDMQLRVVDALDDMQRGRIDNVVGVQVSGLHIVPRVQECNV